MKKTTFLLMAAMAVLSAGLFSCEKENKDNNSSDTSGGETDVEWVDLGLPSGRLWAKCNLGATKPEEYGDYYAWGETTPKIEYDERTYRFYRSDDNGRGYTKYCKNSEFGYNGFTDDLTTLQPDDDAATANNRGRTPSQADWVELINTTTHQWITISGVSGLRFIGRNGNSIFLPAAGQRHEFYLEDSGVLGYYWTSSLMDGSVWACNFMSESVGNDNYNYWFNDCDRCDGLSVRAVR